MKRPGAILLLLLPSIIACVGAPAGPAPRVAPPAAAVLDTVRLGTLVRLPLNGQQVTRVLRAVTPDSITIDRSGRDTTIARDAADTIWVKRPRTYHGTALGIGAGLAVAAVIVLNRRGHQDGATGAFALRTAMVLIGFGALGDLVEPVWTGVPLGYRPGR